MAATNFSGKLIVWSILLLIFSFMVLEVLGLSAMFGYGREEYMWGRIIDWYGGVPYKPPTRRNIMKPNPHYINMIINFSILGTLIYVAIQVS